VTAETSALPLVGRDRVIGYGLLVLAVLCVVGPFAWILMSSFKHQIAILTGAWSFTPTLSNFGEVLFGRRSDFAGNVANSAIVAATSTVLVLIVGTLAAYSLYRFAWARWVTTGFLGWTLVFHMIPALTLVGPWYLAFRELGWYNTLGGLVLTHVTLNLPMTVWLMMAFFREIPPEIGSERLTSKGGTRTYPEPNRRFRRCPAPRGGLERRVCVYPAEQVKNGCPTPRRAEE